jgi:hypothetical protein
MAWDQCMSSLCVVTLRRCGVGNRETAVYTHCTPCTTVPKHTTLSLPSPRSPSFPPFSPQVQ